MMAKLNLAKTFLVPKFEYVLFLQHDHGIEKEGKSLIHDIVFSVADVTSPKLILRARAALRLFVIAVRS